ncbi:hypothetical protein RSO41_12395 [Halomonas sp. I1]|uniref:hypothetical protein n=1 Tax=Halomonas sp. I1 TaxID=393536 RepID=UPI0028DE5BB6|nr:hypothetical protein [Halomonas sp. I1]MDT8895456.1 hypothetical protein [Halomonas sp. I1]
MAKPEDDLLYDILHKAEEAFPEPIDVDPLNSELGDDTVTGAIDYLVDHGLVDVWAKRTRMSGIGSYAEIRINGKGIDLLRDDGGMTARLNVITVRLEADTLRILINQRIDNSDESTHRKLQLREWVSSLPERALNDLTSQLIRRGLQEAPGTIQWLYTQMPLG